MSGYSRCQHKDCDKAFATRVKVQNRYPYLIALKNNVAIMCYCDLSPHNTIIDI